MTTPPLSPQEVTALGEEWYERYFKPQMEAENIGKFLVVNVDTGDYKIGQDYIQPTEQLLAERPNAVLYALRVGYRSLGRIGGRYTPGRR